MTNVTHKWITIGPYIYTKQKGHAPWYGEESMEPNNLCMRLRLALSNVNLRPNLKENMHEWVTQAHMTCVQGPPS